MSYSGISVRDAMERLNCLNNGWYLPQIQRQYVWGQRYESEAYICLLLDSLFRGYPIGGIVIWETEKKIPFREFVKDYNEGNYAKIVPDSRWGTAKSLVYDGQQRLQTLFSVLYHRFNNRTLGFDLCFDRETKNVDVEDTGFLFVDNNRKIPPTCLLMPELCSYSSGNQRQKAELENRFLGLDGLSEQEKLLIRSNIGALWDIFVDRKTNSIAYFKVLSDNDDEVNEVFRRLNIGGITLTQTELVLSAIKSRFFDFEEKLWFISTMIKNNTFGFHFSSSEILQSIYLLIFGSSKIDASRIEKQHYEQFYKLLDDSQTVFVEFFENYLWGQFKINDDSIVPRKQALLPILVYLFSRKEKGHSFEIKRLQEKNLSLIHKYFLLSQFCDWNTQTMIVKFSAQAKSAGELGKDFPFEEIAVIAEQKNRNATLFYHQFVGLPLLALKVLTPNRAYRVFESKPQIDHIFPTALIDDSDYKAKVNVLWNFQPLPPVINNFKRAKHPYDFFSSPEGSKFYSDYDFLPDLNNQVWRDYRMFLFSRHKQMRKYFKKRYGIPIIRHKIKNTQILTGVVV